MGRAGYNDDIDQWAMIRWRGQVASAIRGKRGQAFLLELIAALDALPEKALISGDLAKQLTSTVIDVMMLAAEAEQDEEDHPHG